VLRADAADFAACGSDGVDLFFGGGLGPGEGIEDGFDRIAKSFGKF